MNKLALLLISLFVSTIVMADERSLYNFSWLDKDKEIYVLQNRRFRKDGNFFVGATGGKTLNGAFIDSYGGTFRAGYFFREDWGIELLYGKNTGNENDTARGVKEQGTVPFYRKIDSYAGGMVMWAPFYSKINTFNRIFYYDWMFGLGAATITTQDNRNKFTPGADEDKLTNESNVGMLWNTGFRFYISDSWSLRLDFTGLTYQANKTKKSGVSTSETKKLFSNFDLGLGLNYTF
jgi:outer membrane beta-barrel protein